MNIKNPEQNNLGGEMEVLLEPTAEFYEQKINGVDVPVRIWSGTTGGGIAIRTLMLSIAAEDDRDTDALMKELPWFMVKSKQIYDIGDHDKDKPN